MILSAGSHFYFKTEMPELIDNTTFQGVIYVLSPMVVIYLLMQALGSYFSDE